MLWYDFGKKINKYELDIYLDNGWVKGIVCKVNVKVCPICNNGTCI